MSASPSLLIVPGIYEGTEVFEPLINRLHDMGHGNVSIAGLPSTGTDSHREPMITMDDDVASIADDMKRAVDDAGSSGVVLLLHSAGGYLGSAAMKGLSVSARKAANLEGGIRKVIFLSAGIAPEGFKVGPGWFMVFSEDESRHDFKDPQGLFFNDYPPEKAQPWIQKIRHQPGKEWDSVITYCGWRDVPSVYILLEADIAMGVELQETCAERAGSAVIRVPGAGHMAHITRTDEIANIIDGILREKTS